MCFFCERYWWTKGNFLLYNFQLHNYYFAVKIIQLPCYPTAFVLQVNNIPVNVFPITFPGHSAHMLNSSKDLPKIVIANFSQGSAVKSMDFHPGKQSLLLGLLMLLNKFVFFGFFCFLFLVKFTCCMVSGILFYFPSNFSGNKHWRYNCLGGRQQAQASFSEFQDLGPCCMLSDFAGLICLIFSSLGQQIVLILRTNHKANIIFMSCDRNLWSLHTLHR